MSVVLPKKFRYDINGLRAWAVVAVILFHFKVLGFAGGFVGVDIFFVISGLLMTKIIVTGLESNSFSYSRFMFARAKRIFPVLAVLCVALLVFGWFWLSTIDYQKLGTHIVGAALFISNHKLYSEAGYFDAASYEKWLLHSWSLSVEWQFYLLLPLVLMLAWRWRGKQAVLLSLLAIALVSFMLSVYAVETNPSAAFYLLPFRAWEMVTGGLIWWVMRHKQLGQMASKVIELLGFTLILMAIFGFNEATPWPGGYALVPVLGAVLVLAANRQESPLTANPLIARVGLISYSLYLWHWPIVVFLAYAGEQNNPTWIVAGILLTFAFGELSYRFIETRSSYYLGQLSFKKATWVLFCVLLLVELLAVTARHLEVEGRLPKKVEKASQGSFDRNPRLNECLFGPGRDIPESSCIHGTGKVQAVVVGDSHANAVISSVVLAAEDKGSVVEMTYNGCSTLIGAKSHIPKSQCDLFNQHVLDTLSTTSDIPVILISRLTGSVFGYNERHKFQNRPVIYFGDNPEQTSDEVYKDFVMKQIETVCQLSQYRPVYLVRPLPEMDVDVPTTVYRNLMFNNGLQDVFITDQDYMQRHTLIWQAQDKAAAACGAKVLNPLPYLCVNGRCMGSKDGLSLYYDTNHLSEYGNKFLTPMFKPLFQ
ncbi:acyltransferase family protein [Shewanella indica]|uniref:acyltransferase family protein n=1 Tax=Shewanella indica TaxID=768528 RepID=UPI003999E258